MKKEYTIAGVIGIIAIILLGGPMYNAHYISILNSNPEQDLFILDFDSKDKVEVLTRTSFPDCPYGIVRITDAEIKLKCGWSVAGVYSSWTEYWRTYGTNKATGEDEWWQRNNRKRRLVNLDYKVNGDTIIVTRITPFYKGRSGSDGILWEDFMVYEDGLKITSHYAPDNNAKHRIIYREDKETDYIDFDSYDPSGNYKYSFNVNGKNHYVYGEKKGKISLDPSVILTSPEDKGASANITGGSLEFNYNCSSGSLDQIVNSTLWTKWNSTIGFNETIINATASDISQKNLVNWTIPSYVDTWPYAWKVQCCSNHTTLRDRCVNSSIRLIALNIRPDITTGPDVNSTIRSDQRLTCTLDEDYITSYSSGNRLTFSGTGTNVITNGIVNVSFTFSNSTTNLTVTPWQPNLTVSWGYDVLNHTTTVYNFTKDSNVSCHANLFDGKQYSSWVNSTDTSGDANITSGEGWGLNITSPDGDINILNGTEDSKRFTVNWTAPDSIEKPTYYYSAWLQTTVGTDSYHLFNYSELSLISSNVTSDQRPYLNFTSPGPNNGTFNSSSYAQGNYYINLTACEGNFTGHPTSSNCLSDATTNTLDIFDYSIEFGPGGVNTFRTAMPPKGETGEGFIPYGQTSSVGIFKVTSTAYGDLNFTIHLNESLDPCFDLWCAPYSKSKIYDNTTYSQTQGWNITNISSAGTGSQNTTLYKFRSLSNYIWCFTDVVSACPLNVGKNWLFNFDVHPDTASAY